jgi:hypothetical protein
VEEDCVSPCVATAPTCWTTDQTPVQHWSNAGQTLVEHHPRVEEDYASLCVTIADLLNTGQKHWSNTGQTLDKQDSRVEEDYVSLCVASADLLDHSDDYVIRCGLWAEQVLCLAVRTRCK